MLRFLTSNLHRNGGIPVRWSASPTARNRCRTLGIWLTACALTFSGISIVSLSVAQAEPTSSPSATATATAQAQASGQPVAVDALTSPTSQVMANADGTFTLTSNREPVRIKRDGQWIPIDTSLVRNSDGSYSPSAADVGLTFSGGGSGPALTIGDPSSDGTISISWPAPLPAPTITDDTATYAEVLPGVDLVLTAQGDSYSETLVVHDAAAAANPQLQSLRMTFAAHHLDLAKTADGGLSATDPSGTQVFDGATPTVWDSSFDPQYGGQPTATDPGGAQTAPIAVSLPQIEAANDNASATATLAPPQASLVGPDVQYPVYIDPVLSKTNPAHFLVVSGGSTSLHYYDTGSDLKVGDCDWGASCNNIGVARSFFNFDITALTGPDSWQDTTAKVFDAEVDVYQIHNGAGCTAEPVSLYTASAFTPGTTWPGPGYSTNLGSVSTGYSDSCGSGTGGDDKFIPSLLPSKLEYAATLGKTITLGLHSPDETDRNQWKRFNTNPTLVVHYSYAPSRLTATGITGAVSCNGRIYVKNQYPVLTGTAHDNNDPHYPLTMRFYLNNANGSSLLAYGDRDTTDLAATQWPDTYATVDGTTYEYQVNAYTKITDPNDHSLQWGTASSIYSFTAAYNSPTGAVNVGSADYPSNNWGITGAQPGTFALRDGDATAVGFTYHFDGGAGSEPTPTSCATTTVGSPVSGGWAMATAGQAVITAPTGLSTGRHTLYVKGFNGAMLPSSTQETAYTFYVAPGAGTSLSNRAEAEDGSRISYPATATIGTTTTTNATSSTILDLTRWLVGSDNRTEAGPVTPSGGVLQNGLGLAYSDASMPGTLAMYDCIVGSTDHFTSLSPTCEGQTRASTTAMAYLYSAAPTGPGAPNTHAFYRCRTATGEHFDSTASNCQGFTVDSTLGYLLDGIADQSSPTLTSLSAANGGRYIATNAVGSQFTATFTTPVAADYALGVELITGPNNGKINFSIAPSSNLSAAIPLGENGIAGPVDDSSPAMAERYALLGGPHLAAGSYTLIATIAAAGSGGGYGSEFDFLTLAPINNIGAVPNNIAITQDGAATGASLEGGGALSQNALQAADYVPGQPFTADNILFTPFGRDTLGNDNISTAGQVYTLPTPITTGTELDLLVLAAGGSTPNSDPGYQLSINYGNPTDPLAPFTYSSVPLVPDWRASLNSAPATSPDGTITREAALTLHQYNNGATSVPADVQMYVLRVKITPTTSYPLTSITLPTTSAGIPGQGQLHVFAITGH